MKAASLSEYSRMPAVFAIDSASNSVVSAIARKKQSPMMIDSFVLLVVYGCCGTT